MIVGPYGCGKTTVTGTIISNLQNTSRDKVKVLAVAPSNAATDHMTEALDRHGLKVLRVVAKSQEPKIDSSLTISQYCLHIKLKLMNHPEGITPSEKNKKETEESMKLIEEADVILTTYASARMETITSAGKFTAIIIDTFIDTCFHKK